MVVMVINGALFSSVTSQYGGPAIFDSNFDTRNLNLASHVPNNIDSWQELHSKISSTAKDYQNETI